MAEGVPETEQVSLFKTNPSGISETALHSEKFPFSGWMSAVSTLDIKE